MPSAYLLVSHGSRDPRPEVAIKQLAVMLGKKSRSLGSLAAIGETRNVALEQEPLLGTAFLELTPLPLHEQIQQFGDRLASQNENCDLEGECIDASSLIIRHRLKIVPLFLLPGVHVMEDIPAEVTLAQKNLGESIKIDLQPHLGTHSNLSHLLLNQMAGIKAEAWILLAHGSRRPGALQPVEAMAKTLGAVPAYWAVPPGLELQVKKLVTAGYKEIGILPYFLFAGGITDAIAQSVEQLKMQFLSVNLHLAEPIGASEELADLIWDLTT